MDLIERRSGATVADRRHPWEVARVNFVLSVLRRYQLLGAHSRWLDVGAGDAWCAEQIAEALPLSAHVTAWDINYGEEDLLGGDGVVDRTAVRPDGRFDRILMLDVIEHVEHDAEFVAGVVEDLLERSGSVLVTVPAYQQLYSEHDLALRHHRRYSPAECRSVLRGAGLAVRAEGGLFHSLVPARAAQVVRERVRIANPGAADAPVDGIGTWNGGAITSRVLDGVLAADARVSLALGRRSIVLPGLSYWALCEPEGM